MPPKLAAKAAEPAVVVPPVNPEEEEEDLAQRLDVLADVKAQQDGEDLCVEIMHDVTEMAGDLFISRHYDLLAVNYAVLGSWESMMQVIETSLVTHDRGVHQYDHQIIQAHERQEQQELVNRETLLSMSGSQSGIVLPTDSVSSMALARSPDGEMPLHNPLSPGFDPLDKAGDAAGGGGARQPPRRRIPAPARKRRSKSPSTAGLVPIKAVPPPTMGTAAEVASSTIPVKEEPPFDPELETQKTWRAGSAPPGIASDLHSRHSINMKAYQQEKQAVKETGKDGTNRGPRKSRIAGSHGFSTTIRQDSTMVVDTPPTSSHGNRTSRSRSLVGGSQTFNHLKTPQDRSFDRRESLAATPAVKDQELSPEDLELQEEVSQQRAKRLELVEVRDKINRQLHDKSMAGKNFQIDHKTGTVIPVHNAESSARKPDQTRYAVNTAHDPYSQPTPQPVVVTPPAPVNRPGGPPRLNTAPAGSSRPREADFFTPESGSVAMVVEVPLAAGVGLHEADGTQRKNDYTLPKNRVSRGDYKKILAQHTLASQLPDPALENNAESGPIGGKSEAVGGGKKDLAGKKGDSSSSAGDQAHTAALTAASLAKHLPAPPAKKSGAKNAKGSQQETARQVNTARRASPRRAGQAAVPGYPVSMFPKGGAPAKMTPRSITSTPRSPRRMQHDEVTKAVEKVQSEVIHGASPRSQMQRNLKAEEEGLIEDLLSEVDEGDEEGRAPAGPLFT